jgi:hypothetical protein
MTCSKKPGVAFWATVVVVVVLTAYPLSAGAWCWALRKWGPHAKVVRATAIFAPLALLSDLSIYRPFRSYCDWCFEQGRAGRCAAY